MTITKLKKQTFKHIEAELYYYHETLREIERLRKEILFEKVWQDENVGGGRSNLPSSPTERAANRLLTHKRLKRMEEITTAIDEVYRQLPDEYKKLVKLKYWTKPQRLTMDGIAEALNVGRATVFRWRNEIIYAIAETIGWR